MEAQNKQILLDYEEHSSTFYLLSFRNVIWFCSAQSLFLPINILWILFGQRINFGPKVLQHFFAHVIYSPFTLIYQKTKTTQNKKWQTRLQIYQLPRVIFKIHHSQSWSCDHLEPIIKATNYIFVVVFASFHPVFPQGMTYFLRHYFSADALHNIKKTCHLKFASWNIAESHQKEKKMFGVKMFQRFHIQHICFDYSHISNVKRVIQLRHSMSWHEWESRIV